MRPSLIIEVVSPGEPCLNDTVTKFIENHKAGVPTYIIIDREKEDDWPMIRAYRHAPGGYEPLALDDRDGLLLEPLGLRLCANQNGIVLYDATSGEEMRDYVGVYMALEAARAARQQAEEQARLVQEEVRMIQDRARAEAVARQKADEQARTADEPREKSDEEFNEVTDARADLERQLRELKEKLQGGTWVRDLRPPSPGPPLGGVRGTSRAPTRPAPRRTPPPGP